MLRAMQLRRLPLVIFKSGVSRQALSVGIAGIALASLSGCAYGSVRQVLRAQFASEVGCSDVTIKKRDFWYISDNPHQYKISGCGVMRTYTCASEDADGLVSYDEPACKWEEGDADAPKPKTQAMPEGMDEGMDEEPMDEPSDSMDEPPPAGAAEDDGLDADADLDAEGDAPKGKVKAKAKGGLRLGSD
jgi:hypothetical protein